MAGSFTWDINDNGLLTSPYFTANEKQNVAIAIPAGMGGGPNFEVNASLYRDDPINNNYIGGDKVASTHGGTVTVPNVPVTGQHYVKIFLEGGGHITGTITISTLD